MSKNLRYIEYLYNSSPAEELVFSLHKDGRDTMEVLSLSSNSDQNVAYKVGTFRMLSLFS